MMQVVLKGTFAYLVCVNLDVVPTLIVAKMKIVIGVNVSAQMAIPWLLMAIA